MNRFVKYVGKIKNEKNKAIRKISVKLKVNDVSGTFNFTDIMLQECSVNTGYTINTSEMIKKTGVVKHYNILVRGQGNGIIVNNDGEVTTGLSFDVLTRKPTTGSINIETLHKTRKLKIDEKTNSTLTVDSFKYKIYKDGKETRNYKGSFLSIPSGFGLYTIDMNNRDIANLVFKINEYDKKDRY